MKDYKNKLVLLLQKLQTVHRPSLTKHHVDNTDIPHDLKFELNIILPTSLRYV